MVLKNKLILASGSPRRVELLGQAGLEPARLMPMDVDETPKKAEHPRSLARRLSGEKAEASFRAIKGDPAWQGSYILAADTVVAVGRRILGKCEYADEASSALNLLSGRNHRVYTGICLITPDGRLRQKIVESKVRFRRLSAADIDAYLASGEWRGKAGAYAIQGIAGSFVQKLVGSYTNVVGLPLYETTLLLAGEGFDIRAGWGER
ncbi:MAG: septum formation protein Maf [Rhizobiales bacterium 63-7]|uniref:Maf-like protein n=1 Tax=Rhizobium sp. YJ-22 TaxID=3037556 RepID=UPI0009295956|nr:Maf-like protein [Rhizobium sp. YJ-22]MBN9031657.1 Maf-like protein [Hyphomicrobiales bacterium]MDG3575253.1 Maf-like protein [Rhizobium sp. YJ-22]OJU70334.1 MAG: septum formation protein Maf [Rhizobiales bacterium 63-7]